jgi:hypothetical protein
MTGEPMRRSFPPPRRPPTVLDILIRWRVEIATAVAIGFAVEGLGTTASGLLGCTVALLVAFVPPVRRTFVGLLLSVVVTHRVRVALVESGVASRSGKLPWLVFARSHGQVVMVHVWLRAGTTCEDLDRAVPVIRSACGAVDVQVVGLSSRYDRAVIMVARPRWGWPGR